MKRIVIIGGPTASMKSDLAMKIAMEVPAVIINADSMQLYHDVPILSAQPTKDDIGKVSHKLYRFVSGDTIFSVGKWLELVVDVINIALERNITPIVVGGTGMYIQSLVNGLTKIPDIDQAIKENVREYYDRVGKEEFIANLKGKDREFAKISNIQDKQRLLRAYEVFEQTGKSILYWQKNATTPYFEPERFIYIVSDLTREDLYYRCNERLFNMIENGGLDEVQFVIENYSSMNEPIWRVLGLKELSLYVLGEKSLKDSLYEAQSVTRKFAKRQVTWFKNQTSNLNKITYQSDEDFREIVNYIKSLCLI